MSRNGTTRPFPNAFIRPPACRSCTCARQPRVQAGEEAPHRETVPTWISSSTRSVTFLNHGSYGACPAPVFERYQELQRELERNPVEFLGRRFHELTAEARAALAGFVGARADDLVFVPNATSGLNAVIRSLRLEPGDEVLTTRHEYGAVIAHLGVRRRDARLRRAGASSRPRSGRGRRPSPSATSPRRRRSCCRWRRSAPRRARRACSRSWTARTCPASCRSTSRRLGADVYAGNCHKWLCGAEGRRLPLGAAGAPGLDRPARRLVGLRRGLRPPRHGWQGTRDPAAALAVPAAIEAHRTLRPRALPPARRLLPRPPAAGRADAGAADVGVRGRAPTIRTALQRRLFDEHRIEVVVREWEGRSLLRVSIGPYNEAADVERLLERTAPATLPVSERP